MLIREQINCLKEMVKVLAPIEQATRELSTEDYVSCSLVIPMIHSVRETLKVMNTTDPIAMTLKENILKELNLRFKNMELNKIYAVATILDPRFKKLHLTSALAVSDAIRQISKEMKISESVEPSKIPVSQHPSQEVADEDDTCVNVWKVHDTLLAKHVPQRDEAGGVPVELRQYLNLDLIQRTADPGKYWDEMRTILPNVFKVATKYLSVVATSVPSERLFSLAGHIDTDLRSRINCLDSKPKVLSKIILIIKDNFPKNC